jgi:hypothetical protein
VRSRYRRTKPLAGTVLALTVALATPAVSSAATLHPTLLEKAGYGAAPVGFARTADGILHVVYQTNVNWGDSANGVGALTISRSGHVGPQVQALSWPPPSNPGGVPGVAVMPGGSLEAVFGGSPSGDPGPWGISSADGGASWSAPVDVGSGSMEGGGQMTLQVSNGTPVLTEGCCGELVVQQGFGPGTPTSQIVNSTDGVAGNVDTAVDAASGAVVTSWDSADGSGGLWAQQIAPSEGAAQKVPMPTQYGEGVPLILAGRDSGPGVFAAYPSDYANTTHIRLFRYGGGSVAVGAVRGLHADVWGAASGNDGRIWALWYGYINGKGVIAVTRSNKAVTRFEPVQLYRYTWGGMSVLQGDGRLGPLDMLVNGTLYGASFSGIYYARILPVLSAHISSKNLGGGKFKLNVKVTDAGDPVPGASAFSQGQSGKTSSMGKTKLTITGSSGQRVTVKVTAPGYQTLREKIKL